MNRRRFLASGLGLPAVGFSGCLGRFWTEYELLEFEVFNITRTERRVEIDLTHGREPVQSWEFVLPPPPEEQFESRYFRPGDHSELVEVTDESTSNKEIHVTELNEGMAREFDFGQQSVEGRVVAMITLREDRIDVTTVEHEYEP